MKFYSYLFALVLASALVSCRATYVVRDRPAAVVYSRPAPPGRDYVWVSGNWVWAAGRYQWREGYWAPHRSGYRWIEGHWVSTRQGWRWESGHWRRY